MVSDPDLTRRLAAAQWSAQRGGAALAGATPVRSYAVAADPGEFLRPIAAELMTRVADLAKALTVRILEAEPELGADAALVDSLTASVLDNVSTVLRRTGGSLLGWELSRSFLACGCCAALALPGSSDYRDWLLGLLRWRDADHRVVRGQAPTRATVSLIGVERAGRQQ
jgi:hypothetical protein